MSEKHDVNESTKMDGSNTLINRRRFVKSLGVASGATLFAVSSATRATAENHEISETTKNQLKHLREKYNTVSAAQNAIEQFGADLLQNLSKYEFITTHSASELSTNNLKSKREYMEDRQGMSIDSFVKQGIPTAHIFVSKEMREGRLIVVVQPQRKVSYATFYPNSKSLESSKLQTDSGPRAAAIAKNEDDMPLIIRSTGDVTVAASSDYYCKKNRSCRKSPSKITCCTQYKIVCACGGGCLDEDVSACCSYGGNCPCGGVC